MTKNNKSKSILGFLGILSMVSGLGMGVVLVQSRQLFLQKAAELPTATNRITEVAKEIGKTSDPKIVSFTSKLGYSFNYDKNYWATTKDFLSQNQQLVNFVLNKNAGMAEVSLQANKNTKNLSIDSLLKEVGKGKKVVGVERIQRNGKDYFKLTIETEFLNQKNSYYEYITLDQDNYYVITARYPDFGENSLLAEKLIDSFSYLGNGENIKGVSTTGFATALDESKIVELTKPSVVQIAHLFCNDIKLNTVSGLKYLKPSYKFCDGALGSGFIINKDGYIATNGHVVKQYPDSSLVNTLLTDNISSQTFFTDLVQEVSSIQLGQDISQDQAKTLLDQAKTNPTYYESFVNLIYKMIQQNVLTVTPLDEKYYAKLANQPMVIDQDKIQSDFLNSVTTSETIRELNLVNFDFPNPLSVEAVLNGKKESGSDVAILKISNVDQLIFPSPNLGTSNNLKEGAGVIVIGYPGLVSGTERGSILNINSSATPTITKGIISAIKTDQAGLKLIQVDASIDHGNSGGPAFDLDGKIIGIATYGIGSQSGNFNFLRDIEDLKKLAGGNSINVGPSQTYIEWSQGLDYFWREHYKQAVIPFDKVETSYPIHPLVGSYLKDSKDATQKGQDKSDLVFLLMHDRKSQVIYLSFVAMGIVTGTIFVKRQKNRISSNPPIPTAFPQPTLSS